MTVFVKKMTTIINAVWGDDEMTMMRMDDFFLPKAIPLTSGAGTAAKQIPFTSQKSHFLP